MTGMHTSAIAALLLVGNCWAGEPAPQSLAEGVVMIPGGFAAGHQPDGNTTIFTGSDGLLVFDTGRHPQHSQKILDFAASSGEPIVAVVNSHWHLDHISGNPRLRAAYPALIVYASPAIDEAMSGFLAESRKQALQFLEQPGDPVRQADVRADVATIESGKAVYPDINITESGKRNLAGRALRIGFETDAVTAGDVWLYDTATDTLAAGDLVTLPVPFFDTACAPRWSAALARLQAVDFKRLVPGHGPVMDKAAFGTYRLAFDKLVQCAASKAEATACRDGWITDAAPLLHDDEQRKLAGMLLDYYLDAVLRDEKKQARFCPTDPTAQAQAPTIPQQPTTSRTAPRLFASLSMSDASAPFTDRYFFPIRNSTGISKRSAQSTSLWALPSKVRDIQLLSS